MQSQSVMLGLDQAIVLGN